MGMVGRLKRPQCFDTANHSVPADFMHIERVARVAEQHDGQPAAEVFLVAWRRLDEVPADGLPWLYATARGVIANQRRAARALD